MKEKSLIAGNYLIFIFITTVLVAFQVSTWFQFLGSFPTPQLWVPAMVFWFLYREPYESVIMTYLLTGLLATQTSLPFSNFLIISIFLFGVSFFIKQRFYWSGGGFYSVLCGACSLLFLVVEHAAPAITEGRSIGFPPVLHWLISPPLTMLFALPLYFLYHYIDSVCNKEQPREVTGGVT